MEIADHASPWTVFLETVEPDSGMPCLQDFDKESEFYLLLPESPGVSQAHNELPLNEPQLDTCQNKVFLRRKKPMKFHFRFQWVLQNGYFLIHQKIFDVHKLIEHLSFLTY